MKDHRFNLQTRDAGAVLSGGTSRFPEETSWRSSIPKWLFFCEGYETSWTLAKHHISDIIRVPWLTYDGQPHLMSLAYRVLKAFSTARPCIASFPGLWCSMGNLARMEGWARKRAAKKLLVSGVSGRFFSLKELDKWVICQFRWKQFRERLLPCPLCWPQNMACLPRQWIAVIWVRSEGNAPPIW